MKKTLWILLFLMSTGINAQKIDLSYYLPKGVTYNEKIPTPKSIIGHEVGEWHITHDKLLQYMENLAAVSDRVQLEKRGKTFEGRPLILLKISSPENLQNIAEIRRKHLANVNGEQVDIEQQPVVVYQGFSIHGNEASGSNAALALAYYLTAAEGPEIQELLNKSVILFDPSLNPDGLQRFAYWANIHKASEINPDPNDREYHEVWPGGRTNHYWFDMNRDWLPVQLPESKVRIKTFHEWKPNILTDHHEMGTNSTFFFQPGIPERTHPLTPELNQELTREIGTYHAKALDAIGSLYYSEEDFDDFYYGKGSTFPDINGGIGILFEQGSSRGHAQESDHGVLRFPFTIRNQFTAALSTLEAAKAMRVKLLQYQRNFFKKARTEGANKGILFGDAKDKSKTLALVNVLKKHQIKVHRLKKDVVKSGKKYSSTSSFVVPYKQQQSRLVKAIFDKRIQFRDSLFYDVSAWSFDHAFGVDAEANVSLELLGDEIVTPSNNSGTVSAKSGLGYLMPWNEYYTPKVLNALLNKELRAFVGMKKFTNNNRTYDYGTIFIPVQNQCLSKEALYAYLKELAAESGVALQAVSTGLNGGIDLGSRRFKRVKKVSVAMLVGDGVSSNDAGEIWHLLDRRYGMKLTKLSTDYVTRVDLSRYTTIVVPNSRSLSPEAVVKLKTWVKNGGVLIGFRNSLRWMKQRGLFKATFKKPKNDQVTGVSFENKRLQSGAQVIGGAIFKAALDRSHPIAFGYKNKDLALFRNTTVFMAPDAKSYNNPIQYTQTPLLSGYISEENLELLKGSVPFKVQRLGKGRVIGFTDNTNFRAFWYGTNKLFMNAVFFGKLM